MDRNGEHNGEPARTEMRAYITHWQGDTESWRIVEARLDETPEALLARAKRAMANQRGLMTRGVKVESSCVIQRRTVTPWVTVPSGGSARDV